MFVSRLDAKTSPAQAGGHNQGGSIGGSYGSTSVELPRFQGQPCRYTNQIIRQRGLIYAKSPITLRPFRMPRGMKTDVAFVSHSLSFEVIFGVNLGSESDSDTLYYRALKGKLAGKCDIWQCTWSNKGHRIIVEWEITK